MYIYIIYINKKNLDEEVVNRNKYGGAEKKKERKNKNRRGTQQRKYSLFLKNQIKTVLL